MLSKVKKSREQGFTIIEVLIVLAIAGLIMLIVFLAIPALNRNSRNTRVDADASKAAGVLQEVINNSPGGKAPVQTSAPSQLDTTNGSYAQVGAVDYNVHATTYQAISGTKAKDTIYIRNFSVCTTSGVHSYADTGGTARQYTVSYLVESPGVAADSTVNNPVNFTSKCVQV